MAVGIEVSFWSSSGCVVTAVVPCWLDLGCVSAVTMHSCTAVMRINVKKKKLNRMLLFRSCSFASRLPQQA